MPSKRLLDMPPAKSAIVLEMDRTNTRFLGFFPFHRTTTTNGTRSSRPEYGPLPGEDSDRDSNSKDDLQLEKDDAGHGNTYFVNKASRPLRISSWTNRQRWLACGTVFGLFFLAIFVFLTILVFAVRALYGHGDKYYGSYTHTDALFTNDEDRDASASDPLSWYPADFMSDVTPIPCHSHNDYWRKVPLFTALHAGCIGTEADVWLVDGELYVGHERSALTPDRTLKSLYLDPLMRLLERANPAANTTVGGGNEKAHHHHHHHQQQQRPRGVFDMAPNQTLTLLVDVKTDGKTKLEDDAAATATFRKVLEQVEPLRQRGWLSTFQDGRVQLGPVTLVGSGSTPFDVIVENSTYRYAFFDAPIHHLDDDDDDNKNYQYDSTNSYYASAALHHAVGFAWFGWFRGSQLQRMSDQVQQAHARGLQARYWSLPSWPAPVRDAVWATVRDEGVDLLNVDDVEAAARANWTRTQRL